MKSKRVRRHLNPAIINFLQCSALFIIIGFMWIRIALWLVGIDL